MFTLTWVLVIVLVRFMKKIKLNMRLSVAYSALEGIDLASVGLDLVAELRHLHLGLS